jgi:hypothetical protein
MEREHLIIIALILFVLYMLNKDDQKDSVQTITPMGRIRYGCEDAFAPGCGPQGHIRTREGYVEDPADSAGQLQRIRLSDKSFAHSQHIRNHIRNRNMNSMFSGMMGADAQVDQPVQGY